MHNGKLKWIYRTRVCVCVREREHVYVYTRRIEEAEEHHWFEMRKMERLIQAKARERDEDVCLPPQLQFSLTSVVSAVKVIHWW